MRRHLEKINRPLRTILRYARRKRFQRRLLEMKREHPKLFAPVDRKLESEHKKLWSRLVDKVNLLTLRCAVNVSGVKDHRFVPLDIHFAIIERILNDANSADYETNKHFFERVLDKELFPTAFLRKYDGVFLDRSFRPLSSSEAQAVFDGIERNFIIKPTIDTHSGKNVALITYDSGSFFDGKGAKATLKSLDMKYGDNYIIQERVKQHDLYSMFNESSVNTLRFHTYRSVVSNEIVNLYCDFRMGRKNQIVDNTYSGGLFCLVNPDGSLGDRAIFSGCEICREHPDSKIKFSGVTLPFYENALKKVRETASKIHSHRILGFDIAVDQAGNVKILEINLLATGILTQNLGIPLFGDYTDEVIDYCAKNRRKDNYKILRF